MAAPRARFELLDSLRLTAAGMVLFQHLFEHRPGFAGESLVPLGPGVAGVALFFLVSGYVIPMSIREEFDPRSFFIRRVARIYPLYLAALALLVAIALTGLLPSFVWILDASPKAWLANLALIQDFAGVRAILGVSWTLPLEFIWYGLFGLAVWLFGKCAGTVIAWSAPALMLVLLAASLGFGVRLPLGRLTMLYAAALGHDFYRYRSGAIGARRLCLGILLFALIAGAGNFVSFGVFHHDRITLAQVLGPWALALALFAALLLVRPFGESGVLNRGPIPRLGAMSYSTYLLHPIALTAAGLYAAPEWRVALGLAGTLLLTLAGYYWVERPGIALGRRLAAPVFPAVARSRPT